MAIEPKVRRTKLSSASNISERDADFREKMRMKLLAAVEATIAQSGLGDVQARRIADEAGCAVGSLYNIYGDIDGLLLAANSRTLGDLGTVLKAAQARAVGQPLEARLMALAVAYLDFATVHQKRWRAVFEHRPRDDYPVPQSYYDDRRGLLGLIEAEIGVPVAGTSRATTKTSDGPRTEATKLGAGPDAAEFDAARLDAARALFSATHGNVLLSLDAKLGPFDPAACERQLRFLVHHVVAGLEKTTLPKI